MSNWNETDTLPAKTPKPKLNLKQQAFAREYTKDFNATQAAIRAGYSAKTARSIGYELLTKPHIQSVIQQAVEKSAAKAGLTVERVDQILAQIIEAHQGHFEELLPDGEKVTVFDKDSKFPHAVKTLIRKSYSTGEGDGKQDVVIAGIELHDKLKAIDLFYRRQGLFQETRDKGGNVEVHFNFIANRADGQKNAGQ